MKWTHIEGKRTICKGHIMDVKNRRQVDGELHIQDGRIVDIIAREDIPEEAPYYLPGFIDAHVHIESSMMVPMEFAYIAASHGTTGVIADPHEIGNVLGIPGIDFMIASSRRCRFNFAFAAPSCVPSCGPETETSGAILDSKAIVSLMQRDDIKLLGEMMNFPGVLGEDAEVMAKIEAALSQGKRVDGHAPGLVGENRRKYASHGITTDHECSTLAEALSCIEHGMKVQIREGSAAKNYEMLSPLIPEHHDHLMFCTDDCHPADFIHRHIDGIVRRSILKGYDIWDILQVACVNPVEHYRLDWGLLQIGDKADFISLTDLTPYFRVRKVYIGGEKIYSCNNYALAVDTQVASVQSQMSMLYDYPNHFLAHEISEEDIRRDIKMGDEIDVIVASDGSLLTDALRVKVEENTLAEGSCIQKIVVLGRHRADSTPQVAYVQGFSIQNGAMACSIAHDCHNIVAVGSNDAMICKAINRIVEMQGGIVAIHGSEVADLPLPIAGLISPLNGHEIAFRSQCVEDVSRRAGCSFASPFITLAFMCLPVIPKLKLTDKGLVQL